MRRRGTHALEVTPRSNLTKGGAIRYCWRPRFAHSLAESCSVNILILLGRQSETEFTNVTEPQHLRSQRSTRWRILTGRRRLQLPDRVVLGLKDWPIPAVSEQFRLNQHQGQQLDR